MRCSNVTLHASKYNLTCKCKPNPEFSSTCITFQMVVCPEKSFGPFLSYMHFKLLNCVCADATLRTLALVSMPCYQNKLSDYLDDLSFSTD